VACAGRPGRICPTVSGGGSLPTLSIAIAADHAGVALRDSVAAAVTAAGHRPLVVGPGSGEPVDYPVVAGAVADAIRTGRAQRGVLLCGSGAGVVIAANRYDLVRASVGHDTYSARQMVEHDHANVLALGARVIGAELAGEVVRAFANAQFQPEERHSRRLGEVLDMERARHPNALRTLTAAGQSVWLDNIAKSLLTSGTLARYLVELHVSGVTSNPSILQKAILEGDSYDVALLAHRDAGTTEPGDLAFALALDDLVATADLLRPTYDATRGEDGYVSVEVSPSLLHDADGTVVAGRALFSQANRPNVMVKVPGTSAGLAAVTELVAGGVPVNVTLLFSAEQAAAAAQAHLAGLERRLAAGEPPDVASVASIFVSRWDAAADKLLPDGQQGRLGLAVVQLAYARHCAVLSGERARPVVEAGGRAQRLLFASTGTKNPSLPDTYYLGRLAAPRTIDTIPEPTLLAFGEHGAVCDLFEPDAEAAAKVIEQIEGAGVDVAALGDRLQQDGAASFTGAWGDLLACITEKSAALTGR
jgi:transaldolase